MRVAVFADVHGNWAALQNIWRALEREGGFDAVACAGDIANGRPHPDEVVQFLRERGVVCVRGNGDEFMTGEGRPREESLRRIPFLADALAWCRDHLSAESIEFLRGLPLVARFPGGGNGPASDLLVCHATPYDVWPLCLPKGTDEEWAETIGPFEGAAVAFGHVHIPSERTIRGKLYADVAHGGMGEPRHLGYTVFTYEGGSWRAERRRVAHDPEEERAYALAVGFPGADVDGGF